MSDKPKLTELPNLEPMLTEQLKEIDSEIAQHEFALTELNETIRSLRKYRRRVERMLELARGEDDTKEGKPRKKKAGAPSEDSINTVVAFLSDRNEATVRQIQEGTGMARDTVVRVIDYLVAEGRAFVSSHRIPDDSGGYRKADHYALSKGD